MLSVTTGSWLLLHRQVFANFCILQNGEYFKCYFELKVLSIALGPMKCFYYLGNKKINKEQIQKIVLNILGYCFDNSSVRMNAKSCQFLF